MNKELAICIPTYNRALVLKDLLNDLILKVEDYQVAIYISDNNSQDNTYDIVREAQKKYKYIIYHRNIENLGADRNFENVLKMSTSNYSWLLGDDDRLMPESIPTILQIIAQKKFDVIVTNGCNYDGTILKCKDLKSSEYTNHNTLISDLWHTMTWMSTLIYSQELIELGNFKKYYNTNFLQTAVIFDYLAYKSSIVVYWSEQPLVIYPEEESIVNHYNDKIVFLFLYCWINVILSLPDIYSDLTKMKCIKASQLTLKTLIHLRIKKDFNSKEFIQYKHYFKYITKAPSILIYFIAIFPSFIIKFLHKIKKLVS